MPDPPHVEYVPPPPTCLASYAAAADSLSAHLARAEHVYLHVGSQQASPYAGLYQVVAKGGKTFSILVGQRQEVLSVDDLKAHTGFILMFPA
jgi:hypothetical protein